MFDGNLHGPNDKGDEGEAKYSDDKEHRPRPTFFHALYFLGEPLFHIALGRFTGSIECHFENNF
jgi:hypothetical protein